MVRGREEKREERIFFCQKGNKKRERERETSVVLKKVIFFSSLKTLSSFEKGTMIRFNLSRERQSRYNITSVVFD